MNGFRAILLKEFSHIRRDRSTLIFALFVPILQLTLFGYAINVTIDNIPLAVFDLDRRQESRRLIDAMCNTRTFRVIEQTADRQTLQHAMTSGRAKTAILIPADYSERLLRGEQAHVQVLIDGSDSQVASTALNAVSLLVVQLSTGKAKAVVEAAQIAPSRDPRGRPALPIEARARLLYNPDLESSHFFVPGLIAIILQLVLVFMTSFSIVKEREQGTLEQLFVTPVGRAALLFGKLIPYALLALTELLVILVGMNVVFKVPIHGSLPLLILLSSLFIVTALGLGLLISTLATTQLQAMQFAFLIMMPSVLLSGFMFPRSEMPLPIYLISCLLPVTYFVEILRGVILRAADATDLLPHITGLVICCLVILGLSLTRFRKQLD
ncbi:MAG TPA: ABC transporter permease [Phycisphaerae bacterium]|nr:ABC transporter permease [Phycisphaerae bacterium]HRY68004.1 ABC transporter permease [Phycisphaerae bacterium]HSA26741.1 ABC transporter permease [Phycisphaerae bacterium]